MIEVQSDCNIVNFARDPPGQKSVYILPGDNRKESYRLSTFKDYPKSSSANISQLAASGFFYTGYKDRVKCFSCGQAIENWMPEDDASLACWHQSSCLHVCGKDFSNIPFEKNYCRRTHKSTRLTSIMNVQPNTQKKRSAGEILTFGIDENNDLHSKTLPVSGGCSAFKSNAFPPSSVFASQLAIENLSPVSLNEAAATSSTAECTNGTEGNFPCRHAENPHMRNESLRHQTFLDNYATWSSNKINCSVEDIAKAGFFYLGKRDKVKCWYCNGMLQNWEQDDEPWQEHAKWFPQCEFLLQQKGIKFVHELVARFPNLRRPAIRNLAPVNISQTPTHLRANDISNSPRSPTANLSVFDPKQEQQEQDRRIEHEMATSELVQEAIKMDFDKKDVKSALERQYEVSNQGFTKLTELVETILLLKELHHEEKEQTSSTQTKAFSSEYKNPNESLSASAIIDDLVKSRNCKNCWIESACVVLIPCGHLASCLKCSKTIKNCPLCSKFVYERIRSYIV